MHVVRAKVLIKGFKHNLGFLFSFSAFFLTNEGFCKLFAETCIFTICINIKISNFEVNVYISYQNIDKFISLPLDAWSTYTIYISPFHVIGSNGDTVMSTSSMKLFDWWLSFTTVCMCQLFSHS